MTVRLVKSYDDRQDCARWWRSIPTDEWVACDVETSGLDPWNDVLRLVQFGTTTDAWAIDPNLDREFLEAMFGTGRGLVGWNAKFDEQFLLRNGFNPNFTDDAKFQAHLLFSEQDLHLKDFADNHLGADSSTAQRELKAVMRKNKWTWGTIPVDCYEYWYYGGVDTMLTAKAAAYCYPMLVSHDYEALYDLELEVWKIVGAAERRGFPVDLEYCQEQQERLEWEAAEIQRRYPDVPLGGKTKVAELLVEAGVNVQYSTSWKTKRRTPILSEEALREYGHPIADDIVEFRGLLKNAHTYFAAYRRHAVDGRVHCTMRTMEARTGRMSCAEPNLQNVPKREAGDYVRRAFMAEPGFTLVFADFAQIEYRIFAAMSGEQKMIDAFLEGKDMHAVTAELALGHEPTKKERDMAKNGNFSELYLAGLEKFAATADITLDAARRFKAAYHREFPRIKPFTRSLIRWAQARLFSVETAFGRRIGVDPEKVYAAVNYDIQGTAADVMKRGLVRLGHSTWGNYLLLLVHDEYVLMVPDELVEKCVADLPDLLEDRETFVVPLTVEVSTSKRWGESS